MMNGAELLKKLGKELEPVANFIKGLKLHKDFHVFFAFVLLSTFFWLVQALNKEYDYTISYPVSYDHVPDNIVLEGENSGTIDLKIKDTGFQLLRYSTTGRLRSYNFDVEKIIDNPKRKINQHHSYILTSDFEPRIARNLATTTALSGIKPDTLHVFYSRQVSKKVAVKLMGKLEPAQQRILNGEIEITPDSVQIYGSERVLDTINFIGTQPHDFVKLKDTLVRNIALQNIDGITVSRKRVNIMVPVEMFTEKIVEVPVNGINFPDSLKLKTFPGVVNVSFFVGISRFSAVTADMFDATVDYALVKSTIGKNVPVSINSRYGYISNVRVTPENVAYLLELNNSLLK